MRTKWFPCLVAPDLPGLIPSIDIDRPRFPVFFLAPDVIVSFQQQNPFARRRECVCEGSANRATATTDDIIIGCCILVITQLYRNHTHLLSMLTIVDASM